MKTELFVLMLGVLPLVGFVTGAVVGRLVRRPPPGDPKPVCGCEHHYSFHDESGCHYVRWDHYERDNLPCGCVKYVGPPSYEAMP